MIFVVLPAPVSPYNIHYNRTVRKAPALFIQGDQPKRHIGQPDPRGRLRTVDNKAGLRDRRRLAFAQCFGVGQLSRFRRRH